MDKKIEVEQSYLKYKNHIYNFIYRLLNDHELALDITQQTFLSVLSVDIQPELTKAWFITIARKKLYDEIDNIKTILFEMINESTDLNFVKEEYNQLPISSALKTLQSKIELSIAKMSIATKEIMILYFIENLSIIEIASITERSIISIKVNMHHAIVNFEIRLTKLLRGKVLTSGDQCHAYIRISNRYCLTDIPETDIYNINLHIENCNICNNTKEQLKLTGILLNLTPVFNTPVILDKIMLRTITDNRVYVFSPVKSKSFYTC